MPTPLTEWRFFFWLSNNDQLRSNPNEIVSPISVSDLMFIYDSSVLHIDIGLTGPVVWPVVSCRSDAIPVFSVVSSGRLNSANYL